MTSLSPFLQILADLSTLVSLSLPSLSKYFLSDWEGHGANCGVKI